ncbi:MAG: anthranilate phosphoribosyltransferase [Bacteroidaceae bacterium]|nr:anthranilate phosphoribosyltransferase [Bacteroidaceae bacterium]MBQ9169572.1 anthranilate phosphoribosyltransferase [Bacteroidaceae bacterium]
MRQYLQRLIAGETLSRQETHNILVGITQEAYPHEQIAALLMALQTRGATVDEMLGFRDGLLETGKHIDLGGLDTLDIVGTGGDGKNTFNISTCACFVVAGAGFKVSKHGNGASTSVSGASNVLAAHGVKFTDNEDVLRRSVEKAGICYLHAPLFANAMKFLGPVRKALNVPTCFNLLGPFINPAMPKNSLHGTATPTQLRLYTSMHQSIGDNYGVLSSYDGYDEISLTSGFKFVTRHFEKVYTPLEMGLAYVQPTDIYGGSTAEEARRIFDNVLENKATRAQTDVVIANAACGISLMNPNLPISDTVAMARESIESGKALQCLKAFIEINS